MRRFFGSILAIPLKLIFAVLSLVPAINTIFLCKAIWKISHDRGFGNRLVIMTFNKEGIERAREVAEEVLTTRLECDAGVNISLLEINTQFDLDRADYWVTRCEELGCARQQLLLLPKLIISDHVDKYDILQVVEEILQRNDLSAAYSLNAILVETELYLRARQWDDAEECLERILKIQALGSVWWMLWTINTARGDVSRAEEFVAKARKSINPTAFNLYMAIGNYYLGDLAPVKDYLTSALSGGIRPEQIKLIYTDLWEYMIGEGLVTLDTEEAA